MGYFFKSILQSVFYCMNRSRGYNQLKSIHHRAGRYSSGRHIQEYPDLTYDYRTSEVLEEANGI